MSPIGRSAVLAAALGVLMAFCSPTSPDVVSTGTWGGEHIALNVTNSGATVEFDCAHGTIDSPLMLDSEGQFAVKGSFTRETGGPIRQDAVPAVSARYSGSLSASTLTLSVTVTDTSESLGTFVLLRNAQPRVIKCL